MAGDYTQRWLSRLGYDESPGDLYRETAAVDSDQPYAREIAALLRPHGEARLTAVATIESVPTVCFVEAGATLDERSISSIRQMVWNQNLVSLVMVIRDGEAVGYSARCDQAPSAPIRLDSAHADGPFSLGDVASGEVQRRYPSWFHLESRVDRVLLHNLRETVDRLAPPKKVPSTPGLSYEQAQILVGRCLFVSYLEHRQIIGDAYRERHQVHSLHRLIADSNRKGLEKLFRQLKKDFNGDFFQQDDGGHVSWTGLTDRTLETLRDFLDRVDVKTGQRSVGIDRNAPSAWNYDFQHIPVELISGIYETFLGRERSKQGAYYTPRHLANLVVEEAFGDLDPCEVSVVDPACGSGILLTAAFRRIVAATERRDKQPLSFSERSGLLRTKIRGGDIAEAACRVTAFSLYLSLLEDLCPSDITLLQDDEGTKLPSLLGKTILHGEDSGDWFGPKAPLRAPTSPTVIVSNPPWYEPERNVPEPYEAWAKNEGHFLPRRQIAAAFAHKAAEYVSAQGRVAMVLPASLFTAPTSERFVREWLERFRLERLINFSDLRLLMFSDAIHPCVLAIGSPRATDSTKPDRRESFDYWIPKADVSLAFGRLTVHANDRHRVLREEAQYGSQVLRTFMWGSGADAALLERLGSQGSIADTLTGASPLFWMGKGFNVARRGSEALPIERLQKHLFLDARRAPKDRFVLDPELLEDFPADKIETVVSYGAKDGKAFSGPRVIFPDGCSNRFEPGALFTRETFTFKHSITALVGKEGSADLLRFIAVYLHSKLARYVLMQTCYALAAERPRITLKDIEGLPFVRPSRHSDPALARGIVAEVAKAVRSLEGLKAFALTAPNADDSDRARFDELIYRYFGLSNRDIALVEDCFDLVIPSVQPGDDESIRTPLQQRPTAEDAERYDAALAEELAEHSRARGGRASFVVKHLVPSISEAGSVGIVRIEIASTGRRSRPMEDSVRSLIDSLREQDLLPARFRGELSIAADYLVRAGDAMYLIKPRARRMWLRSQALRDAERIVKATWT